MNYLSFTALEPKCSGISFPLKGNEQETAFRAVLETYQPWQHFSVADKELLIHGLKDEKTCLFHRWIAEDKALEMCLKTKNIPGAYSCVVHHQKSSWFAEYQRFLAPFLAPILNQSNQPRTWDSALVLLHINQLLPMAKQVVANEQVAAFSAQFQQELNKLIRTASTDQALFDVLSSQLTPSFWMTLNALNPSHYALKTNWIEWLLALSNHPKASTRLLVYLSNSCQQLHLSSEHEIQLKQLKSALQQGKFQPKRTRQQVKNYLFLLLLAMGIVGLGIGLWFFPSDIEEGMNQEQTSFMAMTPSERKQLDSIITQVKKKDQQRKNEQIDAALDQATVLLQPQKKWKNRIVQSLFREWQNNDTVASSTTFNGQGKEERSYPSTQKLTKKHGVNPTVFRNATNLKVLLLVFKDQLHAKVYSAYVEAHSEIQLHLNPGEYLVVLPGGTVPKNFRKGQLPFQEIDHRFFDNLSVSYRVRNFSGRPIRLSWETISVHEMYLVDLTNSLELMN